MKQSYAVVFERTPNNYAAYAPDLPGCGATHKTWDGIQAMIKEAIEFHVEGLQLDGDPAPPPKMSVEEALVHHRSIPNDYDGYFPAPDDLEYEDPYAVVEVEVDISLEDAPVPAAGGP